MLEQEIRAAAENILRSNEHYSAQFAQTPADISQSHSINTITSIRPEYVISEDLFAGQRVYGRMSSIRRFFCLFVTFDLLFTALMWLICITLNGDNILAALKKQIYHYDVHTSLFDIVFVAICRFVVLLLFYALLYINHWIIIALSTTTTSLFLISKVFVYDWQTSNQPVFQVLLVLISFVLSWGEAWFLDFRVIPQEYHARQYLLPNTESERAPLIRSYVQGLPSMYTESVGNFYSPLGSPEGSLDGFEAIPHRSKYLPVRLSLEQENDFRILGAKILTDSWQLLNSADWKDSKKNKENDLVQTMMLSKNGKIFKLTGLLNISPRFLVDELFYKVDKNAQWNTALLESHKVQTIDEHTDISYQISAEAAAGVVSSRDFVSLRHWGIIDNCYVIASIATEHPSLPKNEKYIRGENGIGCWAMRTIPEDENSCQFEWVLNTNLKGWIPQYILDPAYVTMMFDYIKNLRKFTNKLKQTGKTM